MSADTACNIRSLDIFLSLMDDGKSFVTGDDLPRPCMFSSSQHFLGHPRIPGVRLGHPRIPGVRLGHPGIPGVRLGHPGIPGVRLGHPGIPGVCLRTIPVCP